MAIGKKVILASIAIILAPVFFVRADIANDRRSFYVDSSYDSSGRDSVNAVLMKISNKAYFYVDEDWPDFAYQNDMAAVLSSLSEQFDNRIYPILTFNYGQEWTLGIDNDTKITVLIHPMRQGAGGYFRSGDEYLKLQAPGSNEREMVYLNSDIIRNSNAASFLAHEFTHLISFNQKNKIYGVEDDTWLNEMRSEYAPTLLGYDDIFEESYLQKRVQFFSGEPSDSILEWKGSEFDYGALNLFTQYIVDHYGKTILIDSLHSAKIGIDSINYALVKNSFSKNFNQIFVDWTIAVYVNDCSVGQFYCYLNKNLKDLRVYPKINFLPLSGQSVLSVTESTKDWAGNWFKIIGGKNTVKVSFVSNSSLYFKVPYIIQKNNGSYVVNFLNLSGGSKGEFSVSNFGSENVSLAILPSIESENFNSNANSPVNYFTFTVSVSGATGAGGSLAIPAKFVFNKNLNYGMNDGDVVYLKILLASEGCVSGLSNNNYFGYQTLLGVKCLQNKYRTEISQKAGYTIAATGLVGWGTRAQMNFLLSKMAR